jgi:hypothetical protein
MDDNKRLKMKGFQELQDLISLCIVEYLGSNVQAVSSRLISDSVCCSQLIECKKSSSPKQRGIEKFDHSADASLLLIQVRNEWVESYLKIILNPYKPFFRE